MYKKIIGFGKELQHTKIIEQGVNWWHDEHQGAVGAYTLDVGVKWT